MRIRAATLGDDVELATTRAYPERVEHEPKWHDRIADWVTTGLARPAARLVSDPGRRLAAIVPHVEAAAADMAALPDDAIVGEAASLRRRLRREGLRPAPVGRAFALVRETAQRRLGQRHFDVQLMGGWGLLQGRLVEMETGEGKTLTATLAACTAALAGMPVHVVTVNDYLARRDAAAMAPLYEALGLRVGVVTQETPPDARRAAYACDVTYCTNKDVAFDYLRDRVALGPASGPTRMALEKLRGRRGRAGPVVMRGLHFGIVDEADSVFIDEARTPLILSATRGGGEEAERCRTALDLARSLEEGVHYTVDRRERIVDMRDAGLDALEAASEPLGGVWTSTRVREELVRQALSALLLFQRDQHYVVVEGKVQIVDEFTGRIMADRSWERGLHQMIESKEGVKLTERRETLARITYQRLFRRYLLLAGMTGTGREVGAELWSIYRLQVVKVPLNRPSRRVHLPARLFATEAAKWEAVADSAQRCAQAGRPVLIGTRSVQASEALSRVLSARGLAHALLNAKQDAGEADVVAAAGQPGTITVATNMAGRGTDIRLAEGVAACGGLHVILTECHESARIDRQLYGRCARQGDPGTCEALTSVEDDLFRTNVPWLVRFASGLGGGTQRPAWLAGWLRRAAQRVAERRNYRIRAANLKHDRQLEKTLAFSGRQE